MFDVMGVKLEIRQGCYVHPGRGKPLCQAALSALSAPT